MAPKLTPEERKALKLAKKEEKKRLKIEAAKQLKRNYLGREVKYGGLTINKREKEWREMLINLSLSKMREDLEYAWHNFERVIDCKNFTISLLMDEVKDAEEQYMMNNRSHMEHIDKLIDLFQEQIEELEADYENEINMLKQRGEEEVKILKLQAEEEENYIKTMIHILDIARKKQKQNVRADYFAKLEEEEKRHAYITKLMSGIFERKFQDVMNYTTDFLKTYDHQIKAKKKEHDELKTQDDSQQQLLVLQLEKIRQACEYIKVLKVKLNDSQKTLGSKLRDVQDEHNLFLHAFNILKRRLENDRRIDLQQLITLTSNYNSTVEDLDRLKEKVKSILNISAVCRKLETQGEKIKPFPITDKELKNVDESTLADLNEKQYEKLLPYMDLFWQRVAQADASRFAINEELEFLKAENDLLKFRLYQYCQCVKCPARKSNILIKEIKNITEGALELKKYEKQNFSQFGKSGHHLDVDA